ncbi:hypothetical protein F4815DRAFT_477606, partial [Daldinia loculata]
MYNTRVAFLGGLVVRIYTESLGESPDSSRGPSFSHSNYFKDNICMAHINTYIFKCVSGKKERRSCSLVPCFPNKEPHCQSSYLKGQCYPPRKKTTHQVAGYPYEYGGIMLG